MTSSNLLSPATSASGFRLSALTLTLGIVLSPVFAAAPAIALSVPEAAVTLEAEPTPPAAAPFEATPPAAPATLEVESAEVFVDRTDYSVGATQAIDPAAALAGGGSEQVNVQIESRYGQPASGAIAAEPTAARVDLGNVFGSIEVSAQGVGWSPSSAFDSSEQGALTVASPYFNSKLLRPFSRITLPNQKMVFPIGIPSPITSLFGWRTHPISGNTKMHTGTDIGAPMGAPVVAVMPGRVLLADVMGGYGMTIALEHQDGTQQTLYAHLSAIFVKPGEMVQQGTVIGEVGSTGNSTGPHLHFELRQLTEAGWMAIDAGQQLELSMNSLVTALKTGTSGKDGAKVLALQPSHPIAAPIQSPVASPIAGAPMIMIPNLSIANPLQPALVSPAVAPNAPVANPGAGNATLKFQKSER